MKGLAALSLETLEPWIHEDLASVYEQADRALPAPLIEGRRVHAARRVHEMEAAREMLEALAVPSG